MVEAAAQHRRTLFRVHIKELNFCITGFLKRPKLFSWIVLHKQNEKAYWLSNFSPRVNVRTEKSKNAQWSIHQIHDEFMTAFVRFKKKYFASVLCPSVFMEFWTIFTFSVFTFHFWAAKYFSSPFSELFFVSCKSRHVSLSLEIAYIRMHGQGHTTPKFNTCLHSF